MEKNPRYVCLLILDKVFNEKAYSNLILDKYLSDYKLKEVDKKLVTEIVYGTIKYKLSIDMIISNFAKQINEKHISTNILRSAIYQLKYLTKIPEYAVLNESVEIAKKVCKNRSNFINAILRNYLRNKENVKEKNTLEYEYSFPTWMINLFKKHYPSKYINIMESLNKRGQTYYRVNSNKISKEDFINKYKEEFEIENLKEFKNAIKINALVNVKEQKLYKEGILSVQDLSSQLACEVLEVRENDVVIDLCASPGGKTGYVGELSKDSGKIISCDIYDHKVNILKKNAQRLGLQSVKCLKNDATKLREDFLGLANKVILDAPCSGLGVIKKKPEIKWFKKPNELKEIIKIQKNIINIACKYLKPGGVLLYTTCTINKDENENIVKFFLENNKDFVLEKIDDSIFGNLDFENNHGMITLFPSNLNDGFFISKIRRI